MWAVNTVLTTRVYMNLVWLVRRPAQTTEGFTDLGRDAGRTTESTNASGSGAAAATRFPPVIEMRVPITSQIQSLRHIPSTSGSGDESLREKMSVESGLHRHPAPSSRLTASPFGVPESAPTEKEGTTETIDAFDTLETEQSPRFQSLELPIDTWRRVSWRLSSMVDKGQPHQAPDIRKRGLDSV